MKKAGELLSNFFDAKTLDTALGFSRLFSSWASVAEAHKIPGAASHSRIVELECCVLLIEADHPGWIQILQTKQQDLLVEFQQRFPDLTITGISFRLSRAPLELSARAKVSADAPAEGPVEIQPDVSADAPAEASAEVPAPAVHVAREDLYGRIKDDHFRESLKRLEALLGSKRTKDTISGA
jgi:hypothetical protein